MKQLVQIILMIIPLFSFGQYEGNTSPDYPTLVKVYEKLAAQHKEIELYNMGESDFGLPIYLCVLNGAKDSLATFKKARSGTTLLINNAIHPGEPDGINACLIWINQWIKDGKDCSNVPVIGIIPAYNIGGMMNRSGTSRANQNGPEEYGFRGNAQNLDLNRDFIKMDSKNMFTFAKIYGALDPDVFIDTHVSNGADYQYTMTYIASIRERMAPSLGNLMHDKMIPNLKKYSSKRGFDLIPYVNLKDKVPENGIIEFNDLPRYAMGYASLMNAISFTTETHMLKPFPERVKSTRIFIEGTIKWMASNKSEIEKARNEADSWEQNQNYYVFNFQATDIKDSILFKGYEHTFPGSDVTDMTRLKYHQDRPFEKYIPYFHYYKASDSTAIPKLYIVGRQCEDVINRLRANGVEMTTVEALQERKASIVRILKYENGSTPYEGHYPHSKIISETEDNVMTELKPGDVIINTNQKNRRFIVSVLEPGSPDSYFVWNYFDSYVQQKEYFSPYVFEDKAKEILDRDEELRKEFEARKNTDEDFKKSQWEQLYFIYKRSSYFEPTFNVLPILKAY